MTFRVWTALTVLLAAHPAASQTTPTPPPAAATADPPFAGLQGLAGDGDVNFDGSTNYEVQTLGLDATQRLLVDVTVPLSGAPNSHSFFSLGNLQPRQVPPAGFARTDGSGATSSCASVPLSYRRLDPDNATSWTVAATNQSMLDSLFPNGARLVFWPPANRSAAWTSTAHQAAENDHPLKQFVIPGKIGSGPGVYVIPASTPARAAHHEPLVFYRAATVGMPLTDGSRNITYHLSLHLPSVYFYCPDSVGAFFPPTSGLNMAQSDYTVTFQYVTVAPGALDSVRLQHTVNARFLQDEQTVNNTQQTVTFLLPTGMEAALYERPSIEYSADGLSGRMSFAVALTFRQDGAGLILGPRLGRPDQDPSGGALPEWLASGDSDPSMHMLLDATLSCYRTQIVAITSDRRSATYRQEDAGLDFPAAFGAGWVDHAQCTTTQQQWDSGASTQARGLWEAVANRTATGPQGVAAETFCDCCRGGYVSGPGCDPHPGCRDPRRALCLDYTPPAGSGHSYTQSVCRYVVHLQTDDLSLDADGQTFSHRCPASPTLDPAPVGHHDLRMRPEVCRGLRPVSGPVLAAAAQPGVCSAEAAATVHVRVLQAAFPQDAEEAHIVPVGAFFLRNDQLRPGLIPAATGVDGVPNDALPASGRVPGDATPGTGGTPGRTRLDEMEALLLQSACVQNSGSSPFQYGGAGEAGDPGLSDESVCQDADFSFPSTPGNTDHLEGQPAAGDPSNLCVVFTKLARSALRVPGSFLYLDLDTLVLQPMRPHGDAGPGGGQLPPLSALSKAALDTLPGPTNATWTRFLQSLTVQSRELYRRRTYNGASYHAGLAPLLPANNRTLPWVQSGDSLADVARSREQLTGTDGFCLNLGHLLELYGAAFGHSLASPLTHQANAFHVSAKVRYVLNDAALGRRRALLARAPAGRVLAQAGGPAGPGDQCTWENFGGNATGPNETLHQVCTTMASLRLDFALLGLGRHTPPPYPGQHDLRDRALDSLGLCLFADCRAGGGATASAQVTVGAQAGQIVVSPIFNFNQGGQQDQPFQGQGPVFHTSRLGSAHLHELQLGMEDSHVVRFPDGSEAHYNPQGPYGRRVEAFTPFPYMGVQTLRWDAQRTVHIVMTCLFIVGLLLFVCCFGGGCCLSHRHRDYVHSTLVPLFVAQQAAEPAKQTEPAKPRQPPAGRLVAASQSDSVFVSMTPTPNSGFEHVVSVLRSAGVSKTSMYSVNGY